MFKIKVLIFFFFDFESLSVNFILALKLLCTFFDFDYIRQFSWAVFRYSVSPFSF